jgi:hypothetical protein
MGHKAIKIIYCFNHEELSSGIDVLEVTRETKTFWVGRNYTTGEERKLGKDSGYPYTANADWTSIQKCFLTSVKNTITTLSEMLEKPCSWQQSELSDFSEGAEMETADTALDQWYEEGRPALPIFVTKDAEKVKTKPVELDEAGLKRVLALVNQELFSKAKAK